MMQPVVQEFIDAVGQSIREESFVQISMMNGRDIDSDLKSALGQLIKTKKGVRLNIVYRHQTKDVTKNYPIEESNKILEELISTHFRQFILYSLKADVQLSFNKKNKAKIKIKPASKFDSTITSHDKSKKRLISIENNIYLRELGILSNSGQIKHEKQDKYKQINKYIEIIDGILKGLPGHDDIRIIDMGSGKGYLTFALYDYLTTQTTMRPIIKGIELRDELVTACNITAKNCGYKNLSFHAQQIQDLEWEEMDVLIALHACDTATDEAIAQGIKNEAEIIIVAPCCHKQIRKDLAPQGSLNQITQFGILKERQAEILTDTIRALLLEAHGYKTNVFEFIRTEHTPKNVIISAIKKSTSTSISQDVLQKINDIKNVFGIKQHHLEKLLQSENG